jgi:hypothetical protein
MHGPCLIVPGAPGTTRVAFGECMRGVYGVRVGVFWAKLTDPGHIMGLLGCRPMLGRWRVSRREGWRGG